MTLLQAAILGLVQGITEFLPVSSSAHLALFPWFLGWQDPGLAFDVALHMGTLLGVLFYFRADLVPLVGGAAGYLQGKRDFNNRLPWLLILATIPGALLGYIFEKRAETTFRTPLLIAGTLAVMGILLYLADRNKKEHQALANLSWKQALLIGVSQGIAVIPGVSRSGTTILTALFLGLDRESAVRFSFLLSIPIIAGAGVLKISYLLHNALNPLIWVGMIMSAASGFLAIRFLMNFVKTKSFTPFVIYRILLALLIAFAVLH